jgi:hypothetical protein
MARSKSSALAFQPGARVRLTGGDNDEAIGLEGTVVEAPTRTWDRSAAWRRGGAWVEWDGLADPSWEKLEWLTLIDPGAGHHAKKKKSPAQLQREIDEALSTPGRRAHARKAPEVEPGFGHYIVSGSYAGPQGIIVGGSERWYDDADAAIDAAKEMLNSPYFEGDKTRVITIDGELVWSSKEPPPRIRR